MSLIGKMFGKKPAENKEAMLQVEKLPEPIPDPEKIEAHYYRGGAPFMVYSFTGEKNIGDMGPIRDYYVDYPALRSRSWQLFLESDVCQTVMEKTRIWTIGQGLKLQSEPQSDTLATEGILLTDEEIEKFNDQAESRFETYCSSTISDYAGMRTLHALADTALQNAYIGGDMLAILRIIGTDVTVQLIDGGHVKTPYNLPLVNGEFVGPGGVRIRNGVEMDDTGRHIAYHVCTGFMQFSRIPAYGANTGRRMAFLVSSPLKFRVDNNRALPLLASVMETASKMDRYKEATLGSAEEGAKIVYSIEHESFSDGSNPQIDKIRQALARPGTASMEAAIDTSDLVDKFVATTGKQAINMPIGSKLSAFESKKEMAFKDFFSVNIDIVCAVVGIPPDVAMAKYNSNYSASRAAIKDWQHVLNVRRADFAAQFYKPIYDLWLYVQVALGKVNAPEYLRAVQEDNKMALEAYGFSRWVGANVPHIDPLKEAQAARLMLGSDAAHMPLTTLESATELLGNGGSYSNIQQFGKELEETSKAGIEKVAKAAPAGPGDNNGGESGSEA